MSIEELIEDLELLRRKLHPQTLSSAAYKAVGWAERPLRQLLDQCREEQEAQSWAERHARSFASLEPRLALPDPLPLQTEASP